MTDVLNELFKAGMLPQTAFPPESRYHAVETARLTRPDGTPIVFLRRRFVPPAESFAVLRERVVAQGDRLDNVAAQELGDPEQFWRLCDANGVVRPNELVDTVGRRIRITLPAGVSGPVGRGG
jgi:hypothetical protein